jgi:hypothetical protein
LWWPTQSPDGALLPDEIPPAQIIRELQPNAKFIVAVQDPVARMYSDYYFLDDSMVPVDNLNMRRKQQSRSQNDRSVPDPSPKSPEEFHSRTMAQIDEFHECVNATMMEVGENQWFRASQICAHDRSRFAVAGWGRISIGLYVLFIEKWLEHFSFDQFLVVRLEDYEIDPRAHMQRVFDFLELPEPRNWGAVVHEGVANKHRTERKAMLPETERALRDFYLPYNRLLAKLLKDPKYLWDPDSKARKFESESNYVGKPDLNSVPPKKTLFERLPVKKSGYTHDEKAKRDHLNAPSADLDADPPSSSSSPPFSLEGLVQPPPDAKLSSYTQKVVSPFLRPRSDKDSALALCVSAFALDLYALKLLLYDYRVPGNLKMPDEYHRGAFHCLASVAIHVDAHQRSHIFHMLKGDKGHLTDIFDPPLPLHVDSTVSNDIYKSLETPVMNVAEWLLRAGADIDLPDDNGYTPLHYAAQSGFVPLVKLLLKHWAYPNAETVNERRTPLHFAAAMGFTEVVALLVASGGDLDAEDFTGTTPREIAASPGPMRAEDTLRLLNITQRPPITIDRPLFPEPYLDKEGAESHAPPNTLGGYSTDRLAGYESDMSCDVDQFEADQVTGKHIYYEYLAQNKPILIRGMLKDWPAVKEWRWDNMRSKFGHLDVHVSSIPYSKKFSGVGDVDMTLGEYMDAMLNGTIPGGEHPWYVFVGHPITELQKASSSSSSGHSAPSPLKNLRGGGDPDAPVSRKPFVNTHLVDYDLVPTPPALIDAFNLLTRGPAAVPLMSGSSRSDFVNAQWAFGEKGTGAPVHFHNTAWYILYA